MNFIIYPPTSPIFCNLFGYPIRYYGIFMSFSFLVGLCLVYFLLKYTLTKKDCDLFLDYSSVLIFFSILGARLFYVLGDLAFFIQYPKEIILINHGGMSIYGAILVGILGLYVLSVKKKFNFWKHCDVIAVVFPLCQAIGRFGNYFNQEAFGKPANSFIRLFVDLQYRPNSMQNYEYFHPTFLYESALNFTLFCFLLVIFLKFKNLKTGTILLLYLIFYSVIRFFIESIRIDSVLNIGFMPIAQAISISIFIISIFILINLYKKSAQ